MPATFIEDYDTSLFDTDNRLAELKKLPKLPVSSWIQLMQRNVHYDWNLGCNRINQSLIEYDCLGLKLLIAWLGVDSTGWNARSRDSSLPWFKSNWYITTLSVHLNVSELEILNYLESHHG